MAEVQLYKRGAGNNIIDGVDGTADSARFVSIGLGVAPAAQEGTILLADASGTSAYVQATDGASAPVSPAGQGRIRFNGGTNQWEASENGGAFTAFVTGAGALGGWTDDGAVVRLSTTGDTVAIGATTMSGSEKLRVVGALRVEGAFTQVGGAAQVTFGGNVDATNGLDVTTAALTAAAALTVSGGAFTFTGSNIDLDPTGTVALDMDASQTVTITLADNLASALRVQRSTNNYIDVTTTTGSPAITLGNTTTNPIVTVSSSGGLRLTSGGNNAFLSFAAGQSAAVSAASQGRLRYNATLQRFQTSVNAGAYTRIVPSSFAVTATANTTTTSATDLLVNAMTLTPAAGTYMVWFTGSVEHDTNNSFVFTSIYSGGVQVAASERQFERGGAQGDVGASFACVARVTVNGAQAITGQWRTDAATATMHERGLHLIEVLP